MSGSTRVLKAPTISLTSASRVPGGASPLEEARQSEIREAFDRGVAEGRKAQAQDHHRSLEALAGSVRQISGEIDHLITAQLSADVDLLVKVAGGLAEWFVGREIKTDPLTFAATLDHALNEVRNHRIVEIRVAPEILSDVEEHLGSAPDRLRSDDELTPGEFAIVTDGPTVELTWTSALARAQDALGGGDQVPRAPTAATSPSSSAPAETPAPIA